MQEVRIKTHLITTDVHSEFHIDWCGKVAEANPYFNKDGLPIFIIISSAGRMEIPTVDMKYLEKCAKRFTYPKGKGAVSTDESKIYIKEKDNGKKLLGIVTHNRVKTFAPMYDKMGYR